MSIGIIESFPPLLKARNCASSVILDEGNKKILYIIGGFDEKGVHLTDTVQKYVIFNILNHQKCMDKFLKCYFHRRWDSTTNEWTESIPMSEKLYGHGCALLHGKIYVIGGQTSFISFTKSVEVFDINGKFWEFKASMKNQKSFFGVSV